MFVDIGLDTANIDLDLMEDAITFPAKPTLPGAAFCASTHPRASLSPHGNPRPDGKARLDAIREIADRRNLVVIGESSEPLGAEYKDIKAGNGVFSHGAVFAFYPNKQITTGEGGMIVTDDDRVVRLCRSMSNQGRGRQGCGFPVSASPTTTAWTSFRPRSGPRGCCASTGPSSGESGGSERMRERVAT